MIKSMTGFGYSSLSKKKYSIDIEIKSLNSKYFDLNYRCNEELGKVETEIRSISKKICLLYTSPSPRDQRGSRMPSSA